MSAGFAVSVVVARLVAEFEVAKLVGAAACYCLHVMQVQRFFIEQTRLADRASPVLSGREDSFDGVSIIFELSPPASPLVPVLPQRRVQRRVSASYQHVSFDRHTYIRQAPRDRLPAPVLRLHGENPLASPNRGEVFRFDPLRRLVRVAPTSPRPEHPKQPVIDVGVDLATGDVAVVRPATSTATRSSTRN